MKINISASGPSFNPVDNSMLKVNEIDTQPSGGANPHSTARKKIGATMPLPKGNAMRNVVSQQPITATSSDNWTSLNAKSNGNINFQAISADNIEIMKDLANFHKNLLTNSDSYKKVSEKVLAKKGLQVKIADFFTWPGVCKIASDRHEIELNPSKKVFPGFNLSEIKEKKIYARLCFVFEMLNASTTEKFEALAEQARQGKFENEPNVLPLSPALQKLARHPDDQPAALYAMEKERIEFENLDVLRVIDFDLHIEGEPSMRTDIAFPIESFDQFLNWQIDHGHPHPVKGQEKIPGDISYLEQYDALVANA